MVVASSDIPAARSSPRRPGVANAPVDDAQRVLRGSGTDRHGGPGTIFPDTVSRRVTSCPVALWRNQIVTVEVRAGALVVRDRALSMSNAAAGDMIICRRMNSKEEFQGVVREDGIVEVH